MTHLRQSFETVIEGAKTPETWFLSLVEEVPYYGGPQEGGWWGTDTEVVAYKEYPSYELAEAARRAVEMMAKDLEDESQKEYGEQCTRELDWLEARGLEADWLPEPDGPTRYRVLVSQQYPEPSRGCREYS